MRTVAGRINSLPGASFDEVLKLYEFDNKLRQCLLDGLETLEVGLAVHVGYVVGKHDPFAHLMRDHLDGAACASKTQSADQDAYETWLKQAMLDSV
ncbi:Abi family protein [Arthrobacter sp. TMN-49]